MPFPYHVAQPTLMVHGHPIVYLGLSHMCLSLWCGLTHLCLSEPTVLTPACTTCALSLSCGPAYTYSTWSLNGSCRPVLHVPYSEVRPDPVYITPSYNTHPGLTHNYIFTTDSLTHLCLLGCTMYAAVGQHQLDPPLQAFVHIR